MEAHLRRLRWLIVVLVIGIVLPVRQGRGQAPARLTLDPAKALTQYSHTTWTTADGLPQNTIGAMVQTRDGYLWLGTQEGLVRFDGATFTVFDRKNVDAFKVNSVQDLVEAADGTLWIGMRGGGVIAYADGHFSAFTTDDGLSSDYIMNLHVDPDGALWVGTYQGGLNRYHGGVFTHYDAEQGLPGNQISVIYRDPDGVLLVATEVGLFRFQDEVFVPMSEDVLADVFLTALYVDRQGARWAGTRDGRLLQIKHGQVIDHSAHVAQPGSYLSVILEDTQGSLWFGMRGSGLFRYRDGRFDAFTSAQGLSHGAVLALEEGREGGLWIGTKNGLDRLQDGKFTTYTTAEGLTHDRTLTVHQDAAGALWIGTEGGGISRLKDGAFTTYTTREGLASDAVLSIGSDATGAVWIGTNGNGLDRLLDGRITHFTTDDGLAGHAIYVLYTDSKDHLWIGTEGGINRYDGRSFETISTAEGLSSNFITAVVESRDGSFWIGTYDAGLNWLHDGEIIHFTTEDGLASDAILSLHEDAEGTLWIGTYGEGLSRWKDGQFITYTTRDGLFDDTALAILEDDQGRLWISCNKGLFHLNKRDLKAFAEGRLDQVTSTVYGLADGMKSPEANGGQQPAAWKAANGQLWFPTTRGVAMIDPAQIRKNEVVPPVVIERMIVDRKAVVSPMAIEQVIVDQQAVLLAEGLTLPPGSDKLEFGYSALSLVAPEKVRYEVKMEGHDADWIEMGARRAAFYTNLDPGAYTFRVRASNNDGVWNEQGAAVSFYLKPFFYQTTWFQLLCVLSLLLLALTGYRMRIKKMKARQRELERLVDERTHDLRLAKEHVEQEKDKVEQAKEVIEAQAEKLRELDRFKTRFFANISHEFRTPLTMIIGPLENALQGHLGVLSDKMRRQGEIMLRNALRLMRLINQLLDLSKLEAGKMSLQTRPRNIAKFIEGILETFTPFAEKKNLRLRFHADRDELDLYFEPDKFEKIFFNLFSNAAKFTPEGGELAVTVTEQAPEEAYPEGSFEIQVRDTGRGIPKKDLPYIFDRFHQVDGSNTREHEGTGIGLALVKELILLHHGTITAESELGVGTVFIMVLPKGKAHLRQDQIAATAEAAASDLHGSMTKLDSADLNFLHPDDHNDFDSGTASVPDDAPLVLVVEDNKDVREYIGSILGVQYRIALAVDGQHGLEQARALQPDLILSDLMMPKIDGNELCRRLKADEALNHIPVILLTARATHESKIAGLEGGADDFMAKPFNARELFVRVRNLLTLRQHEKQLKLLNENLAQRVQEQLDLILAERQKYEHELVEARDRAEASSRLKSAILDNINHEFRTPLATILGNVQILIEEAPEALREFAAAIDEGGQRLMRTLKAVIDLSNIEAMEVETKAKPLDLVQEARRGVDPFREAAQSKGLHLHLRAPRDQVVPVHLDPSALRRVFSALLDNAIKFTEEGEVVVTVEQRGAVATLSVRDTGIGIDKEMRSLVFDAFVQGSTGLTRTHTGCGVGLAIAQRLAERLGGTITVQSTLGQGSTFTVTFPVQELSLKSVDGKQEEHGVI